MGAKQYSRTQRIKKSGATGKYLLALTDPCRKIATTNLQKLWLEKEKQKRAAERQIISLISPVTDGDRNSSDLIDTI